LPATEVAGLGGQHRELCHGSGSSPGNGNASVRHRPDDTPDEVVLEALESEGEWVTNRVQPGKIILGQLRDIEAGSGR
jgi:hypothetical protein